MRNLVRILVVSALVFLPAASFAGEKFDGNWLTTLTCPAKGNTEGYTWKFPGVVTAGSFRAEHGTADQPGYLLITGPIADDGTAKLSASGIVTYNIKAQFKETEGSGARDEGLGVYGRPCTFEFVKQ